MFEGKVFGHLVWPPRGGNGFGYDPMFVPDGDTRTYGEMPPAEKYAGSHRTRAFAAFKSQCLDQIAAAPGFGKIAGRDLPALVAAAASLSTREELAQFVMRLRADLDDNRDGLDQPVTRRIFREVARLSRRYARKQRSKVADAGQSVCWPRVCMSNV